VSVKLRSGFEDTSLFEDNLLAAQAGGAAFVTLHPRTKRQAYAGGADWSLVARAKRLLDIPVVGACPSLGAHALGAGAGRSLARGASGGLSHLVRASANASPLRETVRHAPPPRLRAARSAMATSSTSPARCASWPRRAATA
jgi:hypothetical protein